MERIEFKLWIWASASNKIFKPEMYFNLLEEKQKQNEKNIKELEQTHEKN
jgi:hypothetical protein